MPSIAAIANQAVRLTPTVEANLKTWLDSYAGLCAERDRLEEDIDFAKAEVEFIRDCAGADKLELEGYTITRVNGAKRLKLNESKLKKLLIANGLDLDLIDQCYEETVSKPYTKITASEG